MSRHQKLKKLAAAIRDYRGQDWHNAALHVEADHPDEAHSGCVPILRKNNTEIRSALADMVAVAESQGWDNAEIHNARHILSSKATNPSPGAGMAANKTMKSPSTESLDGLGLGAPPCSTFLEWSGKAGYLTCTSDITLALWDAWQAGQADAAANHEYAGELKAARDKNARLREAAQAVVDRWETPLWKDVEPTAAVIYRLRDILSNAVITESSPK